MTDPAFPAEKGLRATVRMAAGINIGEEPAGEGFLARLMRRRSSAVPDEIPAEPVADHDADRPRADPAFTAALWRRAGLGAAIGTAIVTLAFAGLVAEAALTRPEAEVVPPVALALVEAAPKGDRLAVGVKLASLAPTAPAIAGGDGDITITTRDTAAATTVAMPVLAFASSELRDGSGLAAIDRVIDAAPILAPPAVAPPAVALVSPTAPEIEEEDDEAIVPIALPVPRPRPQVDLAGLPMPKPRPNPPASLAPPGVDELRVASLETAAIPTSAPGAIAPAGRSSSGPLLGFFSSPTEPVRPPSKTTIETPFGVPYVLQTDSVETACIKPELVDILRRIEGHYHQKVVITSGFRDRGRQGSLHRQCAAVDIQVPGVAAATLATFARTIPSIGGVGTYCHPNMIHVDIGTPRDWKYGCGSFFAMRGAPGKWGKVPGALAQAETSGGPKTVASDAEEE